MTSSLDIGSGTVEVPPSKSTLICTSAGTLYVYEKDGSVLQVPCNLEDRVYVDGSHVRAVKANSGAFDLYRGVQRDTVPGTLQTMSMSARPTPVMVEVLLVSLAGATGPASQTSSTIHAGDRIVLAASTGASAAGNVCMVALVCGSDIGRFDLFENATATAEFVVPQNPAASTVTLTVQTDNATNVSVWATATVIHMS